MNVTCLMILRLPLILCLLFLCIGGAWADGVSISVQKRQETVTFSGKNLSPRKVFTLPDPDRLVVDIPASAGHPSASLPSSYKGKLLNRVRAGHFDPRTWRFVFDLSQPIKVIDINEDKKAQLTIAITAATDATTGEPTRSDDGDDKQQWPKAKNAAIAKADYNADDKPAKKEKPARNEKPDKPEKKYSKQSATSTSDKPLIVIDPGHGGVDPGTEGPDGTYEKDVVLAYARELRSRLLQTGQYRVLMTRNDDEIVMLRKRFDIARKAGASMFISLHADSAPEPSVRGLSIYTVSEQASDNEAAALAARENKADVLTGINLSDEREEVAGILISLAERDTKNRSATLADLLVTSLDDKVNLLSNTHRFAGFAVLKAPDIPSVLIEIGFLSHPKEERLINSKAYRDKVTSGITDGVNAYFRQQRG